MTYRLVYPDPPSAVTLYDQFFWEDMLNTCGEAITWISSVGTSNESDQFVVCYYPTENTSGSSYYLNPRSSTSAASQYTLLPGEGLDALTAMRVNHQNAWEQVGGGDNTYVSWRLQRLTSTGRVTNEGKMWAFWLGYPPLNFIEIEMRFPPGYRAIDATQVWDGVTRQANCDIGTYHIDSTDINGDDNESNNWHYYFTPFLRHDHPAVVSGDWFVLRTRMMPDSQRDGSGANDNPWVAYNPTQYDNTGTLWKSQFQCLTYFYFDSHRLRGSLAPDPPVNYPLPVDIGRVRLGYDPALEYTDVSITCDETTFGAIEDFSGGQTRDYTIRVTNNTASPINGKLSNWSVFDGNMSGDFYEEADFPTTPLTGNHRDISLAASETKTYKLRATSDPAFTSRALIPFAFAPASNFNALPGSGHFVPTHPWVEGRSFASRVGGHPMGPVTCFWFQGEG